jgi:hypothetical protein
MRGIGKWSRRIGGLAIVVAILALPGWKVARSHNINPARRVGMEIDRFQGVPVFYNGGVDHSSGRSLAPDGYNFGQKHQCVEFVKRYYYLRLRHRMPDTYGHAKDYFDPSVADGGDNPTRGLTQYTNGSRAGPRVGDLLIFSPSFFNRYGHVAIVSEVGEDGVEIIQQNTGPFGDPRDRLALRREIDHWSYADKRVLGWLRMNRGM